MPVLNEISDRKSIPLLGPAVAVVGGGLAKEFIKWDLDLPAFILLFSYVLFALALMRAPRNSRNWDVRANTPEAQLKQMLGTIRTFLVIVTYVIPAGIFCSPYLTSPGVPGIFNSEVTKFLEAHKSNLGCKSFGALGPQSYYYIGEVQHDKGGSSSGSASGSVGVGVSNAGSQLTIVKSDDLIKYLIQGRIVSVFYNTAWIATALSWLLLLVLFVAELTVDVRTRALSAIESPAVKTAD